MKFLKIGLFAVLLPFLLSYIAYFGFITNYTENVFTPETFAAQYEEGIYRYRYLSRPILLGTYELLRNFVSEGALPDMYIKGHEISTLFYYSYFVQNTLFFILGCVVLLLIFYSPYLLFNSDRERLSLYLMAALCMAFSQFVLTPYDQLSYFLQLTAILMLLKWVEKEKFQWMVAFCVLLVLATTNRESSALLLSFFATLLVGRYGLSLKALKRLLLPVLCFVLTYIGIRILMGFESAFFEQVLLQENFLKKKNLLGLLFYGVLFGFTMLVSHDSRNRTQVLIFHLFSAPYLFMCLFTGILFELRLYMPVFLGSIILACLHKNIFTRIPDSLTIETASSQPLAVPKAGVRA